MLFMSNEFAGAKTAVCVAMQRVLFWLRPIILYSDNLSGSSWARSQGFPAVSSMSADTERLNCVGGSFHSVRVAVQISFHIVWIVIPSVLLIPGPKHRVTKNFKIAALSRMDESALEAANICHLADMDIFDLA